MQLRRVFSRLTAFFMILTLILCPIPAKAAELTNLTSCTNWPTAPDIASKEAILIDAKTGDILYKKKMNHKSYPASITKVMTGLLVLENCSLDETVTFSYRATHDLEAGSTTIARTEGEEMTVEECLYALLLQSCNEVAQALAEHVSGSIEDFAVLMNEKAKELGCTKTHFNNPSGLNDSDHYTTCHDMALIMQAAVQNPEFLKIESTNSYTIPPTNKHSEETIVAQKHALVKDGADHYDGALAGKTGYTTIAGNTLVTYAERGDLGLICVVMGSTGTHYTDTVALLDYGFDNFSMKDLTATETGNEAVSAIQDGTVTGNALDLTEEQLTHTYIGENSWLLLPDTLDYDSLDREFTWLDADLASTEDQPIVQVTYKNKDTILGTGTLFLEYVPEPETETAAEEETEEQITAGNSRISRVLRTISQTLKNGWHKAAEIFMDLEDRFGLIPILGVCALLLLLIIILLILGGGRPKKRRGYKSGPTLSTGSGFSSRPRKRYGKRRKNKYHMK